jgi:UDPglucose 6-dehydrogenase
LWHLGTVTAACLASAGHDVVALDDDAAVIYGLRMNRLPVAEPGLDELMAAGVSAGRLRFTLDPGSLIDREVLWICYDTPVDENDVADVDFVYDRVLALLPGLPDHALVLISSQLPVGATAHLEAHWRKAGYGTRLSFAYAPENLRLGKAIEVFTRPDRIVVGVRTERDRETISDVVGPFTNQIEWMSVESAEMTKHALNAFLATSVTFINEIATICEKVGADAQEVERGLKSDIRIGNRAYLHPGSAFAGGTLARDIAFLLAISGRCDVHAHLLAGVEQSNQVHKGWVQRRLREILGTLSGKVIAVLGLTYKPGTDTLRRSEAVEACRWLLAENAHVRAFDPAVRRLPDELGPYLHMASSVEDAIDSADAVLIATGWPVFRSLSSDTVVERMRQPVVLDPARHLETVGADPRIRYFSVGRSAPDGI